MAASMSSADLREVRGLAQKLWGQCRDSPSLYKSLAVDVRRLRNRLEEVEDQFADDELRSQKEIKVLERVWTCRVVLTELDWTLQSFRCSTYKWQDAKPGIIDGLKKKIVDASEYLGDTLDALQEVGDDQEGNSNIATRTGTSETHTAAHPSQQSRSTEIITSPPSQHRSDATGRPTSPYKSPRTPKDIPLPASPLPVARTPSDEKEVYDASTPKIDSAVDWHNPFAEQDPLSMDIRKASALLSGGTYQAREGAEDSDDETEPEPALAIKREMRRAEEYSGLGVESLPEAKSKYVITNPTIEPEFKHVSGDADEAVSQTIEEQETAGRKPGTDAKVEAVVSMANHSSRPESQRALQPSPAGKSPGTSSPKIPSAPTHAVATMASKESTTELEKISSLPQNEVLKDRKDHQTIGAYRIPTIDFDCPDGLDQDKDSASTKPQAETEQATDVEVIPLKVYVPPPESAQASSDNVSEPSRADSKVDVVGLGDQKRETPASTSEKLESVVSEVAITGDELDQGQRSTESKAVLTDTGLVRPLLAQPDVQPLPTLKAPTRKPPPPPPRRKDRRQTTTPPRCGDYSEITTQVCFGKARDSYKRTSQSSPTRSNTKSQEDLYASSRPTSPTIAAKQVDQSTPPRIIPEVKIDPSALQVNPGQLKIPARPATHPSKLGPRLSTHRRATTNVPRIATMLKPEARAETGLEVDSKLHSRRSDIGLNPRKSVDETLGVYISLLSPSEGSVQRNRSVSAPERQRSLSVSDLSRAVGSPPTPPQQRIRPECDVREYYSNPVLDLHAEGVDIGAERIARICQCWNSQNYAEAEAYLMGHLEYLIETHQVGLARRVRHLLGVCLSFKGEWERALSLFVSVLRAPMTDPSDLDPGDCAAAYWLGDTYALLNRRTEALLAYCMAEQGEAVRHNSALGLQNCLEADQQAVQLGVPKADFKVRWAQEALANRDAPEDTILNPRIITQHAAKVCLELKPRSFCSVPMQLSPDKNRAALLFSLDRSSLDFRHYQRLTLTADAFVPHTAWPMPYDPLFVMANVSRGRLIAYECDLLDVFKHNSEAKVPKSGPLGTSRMSCFTCQDLAWLIRTLRKCLETLDMAWSEVANVEGVWFLVRQTLMQDKIATVHYFSIALFRQSLRSGYGVEVCPDGVGSARLIRMTLGFVNGVPQGVEKATKKFVKEFLESEYKACAKTERGTVLPKRRSLLRSKPVVAELDGAPSVAALGSKERVSRAGSLEAVVEENAKMSDLRKREAQTSPPPPIPPRPSGDGRPLRSEKRIEKRNGFNRGHGPATVSHGTSGNSNWS